MSSHWARPGSPHSPARGTAGPRTKPCPLRPPRHHTPPIKRPPRSEIAARRVRSPRVRPGSSPWSAPRALAASSGGGWRSEGFLRSCICFFMQAARHSLVSEDSRKMDLRSVCGKMSGRRTASMASEVERHVDVIHAVHQVRVMSIQQPLDTSPFYNRSIASPAERAADTRTESREGCTDGRLHHIPIEQLQSVSIGKYILNLHVQLGMRSTSSHEPEIYRCFRPPYPQWTASEWIASDG